jgi:hypothetical protein
MNMPPSIPRQLQANAEMLASTFASEMQVELTFDRRGVLWLDNYILQVRDRFSPEERESLVSALGAFLGEALLRQYGGQWVERDGTWGVQLHDRRWISPFHKIDERFETHRESESIADLFEGGPLLERIQEQRPHFP